VGSKTQQLHLTPVVNLYAILWDSDRISKEVNKAPGTRNNKAPVTGSTNKEEQRMQVAEKPKRKITRPSYLEDYA